MYVCFRQPKHNNIGLIVSGFVLVGGCIESLGGLFLLCVLYWFCLQIENRFSPQFKQTETERWSGLRSEQTVDSRALRVCGYR